MLVRMKANTISATSQQRLILHIGKHILHVPARKADVPLLILVDDILRTGYRHRQDKEQDSPSYQCCHKLNLVLGEEEERQTHDTIKLHKGSYHDKAGYRNIFLYLEYCRSNSPAILTICIPLSLIACPISERYPR